MRRASLFSLVVPALLFAGPLSAQMQDGAASLFLPLSVSVLPAALPSLLSAPSLPTAFQADIGRVLEARIVQEADDGGPVAAGILIGAAAGALVGILIQVSAEDSNDAPLLPVPLMTIPAGAALGGLIGAGLRADREEAAAQSGARAGG